MAGVIRQFHLSHEFNRKEDSDLVTPAVLEMLGDALRIHHAFNRQPLSKDRFEFAFERSLNRAGIQAELVGNRTNRGHDITIQSVPMSLKTQADAGIRIDSLHISKFMELGKGPWELPLLRDMFLEHMHSYERVLQFRCLAPGPTSYLYELVEIPKRLLLEGATAELANIQDGVGFEETRSDARWPFHNARANGSGAKWNSQRRAAAARPGRGLAEQRKGRIF